jgi:hypothetical protein
MLITSPRGNLPGLSGNWYASTSIPVIICDMKERNKKKCTSDAADELHQQHGPKDYAGHVGAERNGSSSCCEQCHVIRGKLLPYLDNWPTLLEFVGELNLHRMYILLCFLLLVTGFYPVWFGHWGRGLPVEIGRGASTACTAMVH